MGILVCVISALFWSTFDVSRKLCLEKVSSQTLLIIFCICQSIFFFLWSIISGSNINIIEYFVTGFFLIIISVVSALLFLKSLKISEISLTIPLLSFSPLFSSIFSYILLEEKLTIFQYIGVFFIIFGTMVLYAKSFSIKSIFYSITILKKNVAAIYMLIVSLIWSLTPVLDKVCLKYSSINTHGLIQALGMLLILVILFWRKFLNENYKILKNKKLISITLFVGTSATVLQLLAINFTLVPIMESIKRSLGQFGSIFFGYIYFKERVSIQKIIGGTLLTCGIFSLLIF